MDQAELELQLKVWKDLAISKQLLMRTATQALRLDPESSQEELKAALETALQKMAEADANVIKANEKARNDIAAIETRLAASEKARAAAEATIVELRAAQDAAAQQLAIERASTAKDIQKLKAQVVEKEKAIKAVNTALADTPENVIKKMKVLKKEKQDEADAKRRVEAALSGVRKEKTQQDQQVTALTENRTQLVSGYRDLHALSVKLQEQLKPLLTDEKDLPAVPELDEKLLEDVDASAAKKDAKDSKDNGKKN